MTKGLAALIVEGLSGESTHYQDFHLVSYHLWIESKFDTIKNKWFLKHVTTVKDKVKAGGDS